MRTKTLILTAALSAAGVATSMAQVYSVNAVGYVNTSLLPGYNLISNPLDAGPGNNTIGKLFASLPDGSQVYKFSGTGFTTATKDITFEPAAAANLTVEPGEGVFVRVAAAATVTFVGEVMQGTLNTDLPAGLSIRSSKVPQSDTATALGLPANDGDQLFQFNPTTQTYRTSTFDAGWGPALQPLKVGEAFFLRRGVAGTWTRTFNVNP